MKATCKIPLILFILILSFCLKINAQTDSSYLKTEEILEDVLQEPDAETDNSDLYDQLEQLMLNPINLNTATVNDLLQIPELDNSSAKLIIEHRARYGNFFSVSELNAVQNLDKNLIKKITPFVYVDKSKKQLEQKPEEVNLFFARSDALLRSRFINELQNNEGFLNQKFEGTKPRIYNRLLVKYDSHFQAGYLAEKDPGESAFNEFSTFHLAVNDIGFIYKAVLMDYYLEFGQGLTLWSPYAYSKGADAVFSIRRNDRIIRPYTSSTENNFFRGAAASLNFGDFYFTGFYSNNYFDASIDSVTGEITSTPVDGLHRTLSEISKRKSASEKMFGGRIDYRTGGFLNFGVLYYNSSYSNPFQPSNIFDISGNQFNYTAFAYNILLDRFSFSGELSYNGISVASINTLQILISKGFTFVSSVRSYPRNFFSLHGYAFGERSGATNNEVGIYTGLKWRTPFGLLNFYYDQFNFPYPTYYN
ncbi:MAG: helix-hairpin-helix domain-containing protein, partial [Ignavibacteriaceae bacterium]